LVVVVASVVLPWTRRTGKPLKRTSLASRWPCQVVAAGVGQRRLIGLEPLLAGDDADHVRCSG
jgi:hypothetical protein